MADMETRQMVKCEGCGGFHYEEDCEVIVIKIVKGKKCEFKGLGAPVVREVIREVEKQDTTQIHNPSMNTAAENNQGENGDNTGERAVVKTRTIVPPAIAAMMMDPGHPMHDTQGAKETRRV